MIVQPINELTVWGVFDPGKPNLERIIVHVEQTLNLGRYGLMLGICAANSSAFPMKDNLLWFGDGVAVAGNWIFVYTGPGQPRSEVSPETQERIISVHWGRNKTIFNSADLVPILFRVDAVNVRQQTLAGPERQT